MKNKSGSRILMASSIMLVFLMVMTSTALAANFDGTWINTDKSTRGMVEFTIKSGTFHGYGACSPTPCDWGATPLTLYSTSVSNTNNIAGIAQYNFGFSKTIVSLKMVSSKLITANYYTQFTDGSGRHNYVEEQMSFKPLVLSAPKQSSPKDGAVFSTYPRTTALKWDSVEGAASYSVEVQYYDPGSKQWVSYISKTGLTTNSYTFNFVGAQPGHWRVWAVGVDGQVSPKSGWWTFRYTV